MRRWALWTVGLAWIVAIGGFVLALRRGPAAEAPFFIWTVPGYATTGAFLAARRPRILIGWLLVGSAMAASLSVGAELISPWRVGLPAIAIFLGGMLLVFPTGLLPSWRWRWVVGWLVGSWTLVGIREGGWALANGFAFASLLVCVLGVFLRYRSAGDVERRQLRWLALSTLWTAAFAAAALVASAWGAADAVWGLLALSALGLFAVGVPLSIAIAVVRYRLYEIDRVISRTVGYGLVVGVLAGLYGLVVVGVPTVLPAVQDSQLLVAAATLAAFFLFNPLRRRILQSVDRRFYRSRYDAERVVEEFSSRLRDEVDPDRLTADWIGVVRQTIQPASVSVWLREGP